MSCSTQRYEESGKDIGVLKIVSIRRKEGLLKSIGYTYYVLAKYDYHLFVLKIGSSLPAARQQLA
jgi:ferredoxin-fold anticodon binding domain-containing protein